MSLPKVTSKNYYDPHIQMAYMGASQFKAFQKCEASALATLRGEWAEKKTVALLVGGYVDAYFSGELEQYKEENPEIFSSRYPYGLKSEYKMADMIIERMKRDRLYIPLTIELRPSRRSRRFPRTSPMIPTAAFPRL